MRYKLLILCLTAGYILAQDCLKQNEKIKGELVSKKKIKKNSAKECLALCEETEGCLGMAYTTEDHKRKKIHNRCYMYKKIKKTMKSSNFVSAIVANCTPAPTQPPTPAPTLTPTPTGVICPMDIGYCIDSSAQDQNSGVELLYHLAGASEEDKAACLSKCQAREGATGCEFIDNYGCFVHTEEVTRGNGVKNHGCWAFNKCRAPGEPCTETSPCKLRTEFGSTDTLTVVTKGIFAIWWEKQFDHSADADSLSEQLLKIRSDCINNLGMSDPPNPLTNYYYNIYIHHGDQDSFPNGWNNGQGTDKFGAPYLTLPAGHYATDPANLHHEGFHIFQYSAKTIGSPGYAYRGDSGWYTETSAQWYSAKNVPGEITTFVEAGAVIGNPQLALWFRKDNGAPNDPWKNWMYGVRQYGLHTFLIYLTENKKVNPNYITEGFYTKTEELPQEYIFNKVGATKMREYFADWAAHNTADLDYLTREQVERAMLEISIAGDWNLWHATVWNGTAEGTAGAWVEPPADLTARGWAYNVFKIDNPTRGKYKFAISGDAKGSEGAESHFEGRVVVKSSRGFRFTNIEMSSALVGEADVAIKARDSEAFLVVAAVPEFFTGYQHYGYKVNIQKL